MLALNRLAMQDMRSPVTLSVIPDATHLFEEPGALQQVSELAAGWFADHLAAAGRSRPEARVG